MVLPSAAAAVRSVGVETKNKRVFPGDGVNNRSVEFATGSTVVPPTGAVATAAEELKGIGMVCDTPRDRDERIWRTEVV